MDVSGGLGRSPKILEVAVVCPLGRQCPETLGPGWTKSSNLTLFADTTILALPGRDYGFSLIVPKARLG
jgi:hypothetical protein